MTLLHQRVNSHGYVLNDGALRRGGLAMLMLGKLGVARCMANVGIGAAVYRVAPRCANTRDGRRDTCDTNAQPRALSDAQQLGAPRGLFEDVGAVDANEALGIAD